MTTDMRNSLVETSRSTWIWPEKYAGLYHVAL